MKKSLRNAKSQCGLRNNSLKKYKVLRRMRRYNTARPIIKFLIWPMFLSVIIWFLCHSDQNIRNLENVDRLLEYFEGITDLVISLLNDLKYLIVLFVALYLASRFYWKIGEKNLSYILGIGVVIFCILLFAVALVIYIGTFTEKTMAIIPLYYAAVIIGYNWFEKVFQNIFMIEMRNKNRKISIGL